MKNFSPSEGDNVFDRVMLFTVFEKGFKILFILDYLVLEKWTSWALVFFFQRVYLFVVNYGKNAGNFFNLLQFENIM